MNMVAGGTTTVPRGKHIQIAGIYNDNSNHSLLNGKYYKEGHSRDNKTNGILWGSWHNNDWTYSLTFVEMMIRPKTL